MSISSKRSCHCSKPMASPRVSSASIWARSKERFETKMPCAPRDMRARAVSSLVSPAPRIMTRQDGEAAEYFLGEIDGDRADGDRAAGDIGPGADFLGDVEGALEELVEMAGGGAGLGGEAVGFFDLAEDFGLAEDHGLEAGNDAEEMPDRARRHAGGRRSLRSAGSRAAREARKASSEAKPAAESGAAA